MTVGSCLPVNSRNLDILNAISTNGFNMTYLDEI